MVSRTIGLSVFGGFTHVVLVVALMAACSATARAQATWTGAADPSPPNGVFSNPGNWSGTFGLVPGAGSLGIFNNNTTYTITFTGNQALAHASVRSGQLSWLSDSATVRTFTLGLLSAGGPNQTLTIGSATRPMLVTSSDTIQVGSIITVGGGAIVVDGPSSTLNGPSALLGSFSTSDGTLRYQNGAQGTISGAIDLGNTANNGSDGLLEILSGADLTSGNLNLATTASTAIGTLNVTGAGSTLVQSGASTLTVGSATGGAGTINVNTDGAFTSGSGLITVNTTGTINRTGTGVFNVMGNLLLNGGDFLSPGGSFSRGVGQSFTVQSGGLFNATPADAPTATVGAAAGTFSTSGAVAIASGELRLNGGRGGSHNGVTPREGAGGGAGGVLQVSGGTLSLAGTGSGSFRGGEGGGDSFFASGAAGLGGAGGQATLSAGTVTLGDASQLNFTGGNGGPSEASASGSGGTGGLGGQVTLAGATITLSQSAQFVLDGGVGGSRIANNAAGGWGGAGGIFTLNSGTLSLNDSAAVAMRGGAGGSAAGSFSSPGGAGGVGGTLAQSGGMLNLNSGKIIVAGGAGGAGGSSGSPGAAGAAGSVNVTGGVFNFTAGQITADAAITPVTPAALVKTTMNVSGGTVNLFNDFTNHLGTLNLTSTGVMNGNGANGANGAAGNPAAPGVPGSVGRAITLSSGTVALSDSASVSLNGGSGGNGGTANPSGAQGGPGGAGGSGGGLGITGGRRVDRGLLTFQPQWRRWRIGGRWR